MIRSVTFQGWPAEALEFYEALEANNTKAFWAASKVTYDRAVYAPMAALLAELAAEFGEGKIFRPYRDIRFSADKSPYKTAIAATLGGGGYIQLTARGLAAGSGMYVMAPDQLGRYRQAVADDKPGEELRGIIAAVEDHGIVASGHDTLKTVPRGYPRDHPRADLLRNKGLVAWREWPAAAWLGTAAAKQRVEEFLRASRPLQAWLRAHVGDTALSRER
jgi:uncharacterized protein (TIGR02453 family)